MDSNPVVKCHDAEKPAAKFRNLDPEPPAVVLLTLHSNRALQRPDAPLLPEIRAFPERFILEVRSEAILGHELKILTASRRQLQPPG